MAAIVQILQRHRAQLQFFLLMLPFMLLVWYATKTVNFFLFGLPLVAIFGYVTITNYRWVWYGMIFLMPLSITDHEFFGSLGGLTFPTDFFCILLLLLFVFKMVSERTNMLEFVGHPISLVLGLNLLWLVFTATASTMPIVSWKNFASNLWMLGGFYLMPLVLFKKGTFSMHRFFQLVVMGFAIAFTIILMLYVGTGRNPFGLRFNPGPFFLDHTVFGGFTAIWVPILVVLAFVMKLRWREKWLYRVGLLFFIGALYFSYSRGAWASCFAGLVLMGFYAMNKWMRRLVVPAMVIMLGVGGYLWYAGQGTIKAKNDAVSRKSLAEHVASITNFRTDFSNAERINRWFCAWEMFKDRPVAGYGPGTYAFVYGDYQKAFVRTPVSTNRGDNGTAHNEFLLAMSEGGLPAGVIMVLIFAVPIYCGMRGYRYAQSRHLRLLYLAVTFGIITYAIHSFVNNFLDQDKVGGTYLVLVAMIAAMDIYLLPKEKAEQLVAVTPQ